MKLKLLGIFLFLGLIPISTICAKASPVKYYHYRIQAHQQNTSTDYTVFRDVPKDKLDVPWYISLESSGEGKGTKTIFWLEKTDGTNVSPDATVKQGTSQTPAAYGFANQQHVMLTAENNTYSENVYLVSGHWQAATK